MNEIEKNINENSMGLIGDKTKSIEEVSKIITDKVNGTDNVKTAIDLLTTKTALQQEGVVEKLVDEKEQELVKDAETKKINAETEKIKKEKEREIAEFDKIIYACEYHKCSPFGYLSYCNDYTPIKPTAPVTNGIILYDICNKK